jgi:hypothetical protein
MLCRATDGTLVTELYLVPSEESAGAAMSKLEQLRTEARRLFALAMSARESGQAGHAELLIQRAIQLSGEAEALAARRPNAPIS